MPVQTVDLKIALSVTQQKILAANPARIYALLVNDGTDIIYLGMGIPATSGRGIRLNGSGGSYEINLTNPFQGELYAVAAAGTPDLLIQEW